MNTNFNRQNMFVRKFENECFPIGSGNTKCFLIRAKDPFLSTNGRWVNQYSSLSLTSNALFGTGSYGSIFSQCSICPILLYILAISISFYLYINYIKLTLEDRQKIFEQGHSVVRYVFPKILLFVSVLVAFFVLQCILVQFARAAILNENNYLHKHFPVKPFDWTDIPTGNNRREKIWLQTKTEEIVNEIQLFFPSLSNNYLQPLRNVNVTLFSRNQTQYLVNFNRFRNMIETINTNYISAFSNTGRFLNYRFELSQLVKKMQMARMGGEEISIRPQMINILQRIPIPNNLNDSNYLLSFEDAQSAFTCWKNFTSIHSTVQSRQAMKILCEASKLCPNLRPGQLDNLSKASHFLAQYNFLAKDLSRIVNTSARTSSQREIAERISKIVLKANANLPPETARTLNNSVAVLARTIKESPLPSFNMFMFKKIITIIPVSAVCGTLAGTAVLVIKHFLCKSK